MLQYDRLDYRLAIEQVQKSLIDRDLFSFILVIFDHPQGGKDRVEDIDGAGRT